MNNQSTKKRVPSRNHNDRLCAVPTTCERVLTPDIDQHRAQLIRYIDKKWVNGTVLHYYFYDNKILDKKLVGDKKQHDVVRKAFNHWKNQKIGLVFSEVKNREEAEVRIGFDQSDGSWSYVGRDLIDLKNLKDPNNPTMNFGWDLTTDWGWETALHEIGHTLGFPHEHQNPNAGIVWNEGKVHEYFRGYPNCWDDDKIKWNVLRKLNLGEIAGSKWDSDSIMHYSFKAGLIEKPEKYKNQNLVPKPGLSKVDISEVKSFYPSLNNKKVTNLKAFESKQLTLKSGEQADFTILPSVSRSYTIQTFGTSDSVMVLFEDCATNGLCYLSGDDDSGIDRNARITTRLHRNRKYLLKIRLYYVVDEAAVLLW